MKQYIKQKLCFALIAILLSQLIVLPVGAESFDYDQGYFDQSFKFANTTTTSLGVHHESSTGAFNFTLPIEAPPGRNGIQANLSLSYNSQNTSLNSFAGYGWSLDIPFISRLNKTGVNEMYLDDFFSSSFDGELIESSSNHYLAKFENGSFIEYEYHDEDYWTATDKSGTVYTFGKSLNSKQYNPANTNQVFTWMLEEVRDTNDNFILYSYLQDSGQIYPDLISYTGHGNTEGDFSVDIDYETRSDILKSFSSGFEVETQFLIARITCYNNTDWVRKYELEYISGDNGNKSLLSSLTESARSESGLVSTLNPTEFYYENSTPNWAEESGTTIPVHLSDNAGNTDKGAEISDVDGDAFVDFVDSAYGSSMDQGIYLNNGNGTEWVENSSYSIPVYFWKSNGNMMKDVYMQDVNGDLYPDLINAFSNSGGSYQEVYINQADGSGWLLDTNYSFPVVFNSSYGSTHGIRLFDVNGDGLDDIVQSLRTSSGETKAVYINNGDGTGWTEDTNYSIPVYFYVNGGNDYKGVDIADVNGDGLLDLINATKNTTTDAPLVFINEGNGTGWSLDEEITFPFFFWDYTKTYTKNGRFSDVNADGLSDVIHAHMDSGTPVSKVYINTGSAWIEDSRYNFPLLFNEGSNSEQGLVLLDTDGDQLPDLVQSAVVSGGSIIQSLYLHEGKVPDLLTEITHNTGASTTVSYESSTSYDNLDLPINVMVVDQVVKEDGLENNVTTHYDYEGGQFYYENERTRKFAGFEYISEANETGTLVKNYHTGELGEAFIGKLKSTALYDTSGYLFQKKYYEWNTNEDEEGRTFTYLSHELSQSFDGDSSHRSSGTSYEYDFENGNIELSHYYGEVEGESDGSFTDITGNEESYSIEWTYATDASERVRNKKSSEQIKDSSGAIVSEKRFSYDNLAWGTVDHGNLTKESVWLNSDDSWLNTEYDLNEYGLITKTTDPRGFETDIDYDSRNLYPERKINALGHETDYEYDYISGQLNYLVDSNGYERQFSYDGFGRVLSSSVPDPRTGNLELLSSYSYTDSSIPSFSTSTSNVEGVNIETRSYQDGWGRTIQKWMATENSTPTVVDFWFNEQGLIEQETLPYVNDSSSYDGLDDSQASLFYTYDTLGRITEKESPVGSTITEYDDWMQSVTDANGIQKHYSYDAFSRLIQVDEENGGSTYSTYYEYDPLHNLTLITDALGNERGFAYDSLSRKISQDDLHSPTASFGIWEYEYDENSNRISQLDPAGQVIIWTYDELNRVETEDWNGDGSSDINYLYDTASNGIGYLASATREGNTTAYVYDAQGKIFQETKNIDGSSFTTEYERDILGRIKELTYPGGNTASYTYNSGGQIESITMNGSTSLISNMDYAPTQQLALIEYGSGVSTTNTYEAENAYRLSHKVTTGTYIDANLYPSLPQAPTSSWWTRFNVHFKSFKPTASSYHLDGSASLYFDNVKVATNLWETAFGAAPTSLTPDGTRNLNWYLWQEEELKALSHGTHELKLCLDEGNVIEESDETDNCTLSNFEFDGNLPNLRVTGLTWNSASRNLQYTLENNGQSGVAPIGGGITEIFIDGVAIDSRAWSKEINKKFMQSGGSTTKHFVIPTGTVSPGMHSVKVCIDSMNVVKSEHNEVDNCKSITIFGAHKLGQRFLDWLVPSAHAETGNIQDLSYSYDANGNILEIIDTSITLTSKELTYTYDDLNRLMSVSSDIYEVGDFTEHYTYDALGNMTYKSDIGTLGYYGTGAPTPHALTDVAGISYSYDANGNLLSDGTHSYLWTIKNELGESGDWTYTYDHSGKRIKSENSLTGENTIYVNQYYELKNGVPVLYFYSGTSRLAAYKGGVLTYYHNDHLDGTAVTTNPDQEVESLNDYLPFGASLLNAGWGFADPSYTFTGKEFEDDLDLYYFEARWMSPQLTRFSSLDPAQYDERVFNMLHDPQSFNAYAYTRNNPVVLVDPNGEWYIYALGAAAGATVEVTVQAGVDIYNGQASSIETYTSVAAGGAVSGALASTKVGLFGSGFAGGLVSETLDQGLEYGFDNIDYVQVVEQAAIDGTIGYILPDLKIDGITSGSNSFSAVSSQIETKLNNGTISNISTQTGVKIFTADFVDAYPSTAVSTTLGNTGQSQNNGKDNKKGIGAIN